MNTQELGKFVAYRDAVLIMPFIEGRGIPHDFSKYRHEVIVGSLQRFKWHKNFIRVYKNIKAFSVLHDDSLNLTDLTFVCFVRSLEAYNWCDVLTKSDQSLTKPREYWFYWNEIEHWAISRSFNDSSGAFNDVGDGGVLKPFADGHWHFWAIAHKVDQYLMWFFKDRILKDKTIPYKDVVHNTANIVVGEVPGYIALMALWKKAFTHAEIKSAHYYMNPMKRNVKPTAVTRRGVYTSVRNTGIEVDGNMMRCAEAMV